MRKLFFILKKNNAVVPLTAAQKQQIKTLLANKMASKLAAYGRETTAMPFLSRLIQDNEKIAAYSFIHSLATTLGMSIYEELSVIIAADNADEAQRNCTLGGVISPAQQTTISDIIVGLRNGTRVANITEETQAVLAASNRGGREQKSGSIADFYMRRDGREHYFEIKTVKPNIDVFEKSKTKLLEWVARKQAAVCVFLAFPYNPYHPQPYERFTEQGMMNPPHDFLIGEQYWNFLGGDNTFAELLALFDEVGQQYRQQLQDKFSQIARDQLDSY